jgi:hypothetical protein
VEVAKSLLEDMESPDLQAVMARDEIKGSVTPDDLKLL